jgi:hypothetical protein
MPRAFHKAIRTINGPVLRAILSGPIHKNSLVSGRAWGRGLRKVTFFLETVSGPGARGGVAAILAYIITAGFRAVAIVGGEALAFAGGGDPVSGRIPLI